MPPPKGSVDAALAAAVLAVLSLSLGGGGHELDWNYQRRHAEANLEFHEFSATPGIMFSFEHPVYSNGYFLGFDGWDDMNKKYSMGNVSYIVRVEFARDGTYKENRLKRHYKRFWLPGAIWVERNVRFHHIYRSNLTLVKKRDHSQVDIWVIPACFLRHSGLQRIRRVAKSMKVKVERVTWLAKVNYRDGEGYGHRELIEIGKAMVANVPGLKCAWVHPRISTPSFSLMLRFIPNEVPSKRFFSQASGYTDWNQLNKDYQVSDIKWVRGWRRALLDFSGGLSCRQESKARVARRYQSLSGVRGVYLDKVSECRFTYQIVLAFDGRIMTPDSIGFYRHWDGLNHIYGVVEVIRDLTKDLKAVLEFEPGLYSHTQMKAIRDEYLKLPGIKFGWVTGKRATAISSIILQFSKKYLRRVPLRQYKLWEGLGKRYETNVTVLNEAESKALIRLPEGKYSDLQLKAILRKYRQLPGVVSVRTDVDKRPNEIEHRDLWANSSYLMLPPKRSLRSWIILSNGEASKLDEEGDEEKEEDIFFYDKLDNSIYSSRSSDQYWTAECIGS